MLVTSQMVRIMEGDSHERVKILVLLCSEDDNATRKAAAGALAMLTTRSEKICKKIRTCVSANGVRYTLLLRLHRLLLD